jgi:serine/threonine-protein kinase
MSTEALPAAIGRYIPVELIGAGASGTVYRAQDPLIGRMVAVKLIRLDALDEDQKADYRERFRTEAQAGGRCQHPAIVAIHDAGEAQGQPFLVMEYVNGRSLQAVLADPAARQSLDALAIMDGILDALAYAHAQGIIHRDIKPANVMVTPDHRVKVADFGIARLDGGNMTMAGAILGTPSYMAPEQAAGAAIDRRTDLFSAAAIFYAILTGKPPFAGRTMTDTLMRLMDGTEADLSVLAPPFACFAPVLRQGLAKRPDQRFADAPAFAAALHAAGRGLKDDDRTRIVIAAKPMVAISPELLETTAARLAVHLGPIARLQVAKAAQAAGSEEEFFALLSQSLPNPQDASMFLRASGQAGTTTRIPTVSLPGSPAAPSLPADAIETARAVLAGYIGPIAKVLVGKALADSPPLETLIDRLVQAAPSPQDAAALRRKLQAALIGKG